MSHGLVDRDCRVHHAGQEAALNQHQALIVNWRRFRTSGVLLMSVALALATPPSVAQCQPEWVLKSESGPRPRHYHAMAYDSQRGVVVMHGGLRGYPNETDLWEWNGSTWRQRPGYLDLAHHAMVYDDRRDLLIVFGGYDSYGSESGRTLAHDGQRWHLVTSTGPRPRADHAMVYDSRRGVVVMFGGLRNDPNTWELGPNGWRRVATTGPSPRSGHAMAYDRHRGVTVLHGGFGDSLGETWEWDGVRWTLVSTGGPGRRVTHAMAYDSDRRRVVLTGGAQQFDTWAWDGESWAQIDQTRLNDRWAHNVAFDQRRGMLVLFGGVAAGGGYLNDTWEYGRPNPTLLVDAECPTGGPITIRWNCATPDRRAALLFSPRFGVFTIPPGHHCAGASLDLDANGLRLVWNGPTGLDGRGVIRASAGPSACGAYLQMLDLGTCRASAAVRID